MALYVVYRCLALRQQVLKDRGRSSGLALNSRGEMTNVAVWVCDVTLLVVLRIK